MCYSFSSKSQLPVCPRVVLFIPQSCLSLCLSITFSILLPCPQPSEGCRGIHHEGLESPNNCSQQSYLTPCLSHTTFEHSDLLNRVRGWMQTYSDWSSKRLSSIIPTHTRSLNIWLPSLYLRLWYIHVV